MQKTIFSLFFLFVLFSTYIFGQNNYYIQLGPEVNFTQAYFNNTQEEGTVKSVGLIAVLNQKLNDYVSIGGGYTFGRAWYEDNWTNLHKYSLLATVFSRYVSFSLVYEYLYIDLPDLNASGGGLGVKINLNIFSKLPHLSLALSANTKNQSIGLNYLF